MNEIKFNTMSDDRFYNQAAILLIVDNVIHEATFESSRHWFYLYNHYSGEKELPEYIDEDDERLKGWAFCNKDADNGND